MGNNYLIPANSKKSILILSFNQVDLIIFPLGCVSLIFMLAIKTTDCYFNYDLLPALVALFLVVPVRNNIIFEL